MHFISIQWFAWMSMTIGLYWLFPDRWRHHFLAAVTATFLAVYSPQSLLFLVTLSAITYSIVSRNPRQLSGIWATVGTFIIVASLAYYKVKASGSDEETLTRVIIPLGMAYYALRLIHYILEAYKGNLPRHSLTDYIYFVLFLPTIVVGPIHRFSPFIKDLRRHHWDIAMLGGGAERILYGYVKVTFLANYLVSNLFAGYIGSMENAGGPLALYLGMVRIGLNLYLQFSGFSDIAIGFSRLLGFTVMENFNWPYLQKNVSEFWKSWHISLTSWCREYIYTTVFAVSRSPALGALATMVVIGLWHEISLRYLFWGFYHGAGIMVWQRFQKFKHKLPTINPRLQPIFDSLSIALTIHFVWIGFVIVRQPTLSDAYRYISSMLVFWS